MTDRARGFALDDGGSLSIYFRHAPPGAEAESNWLRSQLDSGQLGAGTRQEE